MRWPWKQRDDPQSRLTREVAEDVALHVLHQAIGTDSTFNPERVIKTVAEWRVWSQQQDDRVVREAYRKWLDYFARDASRTIEDNKRQQRIKHIAASFPKKH